MGEMRIITSYALKELSNIPPHMLETRRPGDSKLIWDPEKEIEVKAAKANFNTLIKEGYRAYRTDKDGKQKGGPIKKFDPDAGRLVILPGIAGG